MPQVLKNVKVEKKVAFSELAELQKELKEIEKELGNLGRVLLRYSGTENLARVMVEGSDERLVSTSCDKLVAILEKEIGIL